MFDKDYVISGVHGDYIRRLVADIDANKNKLFSFGYDVFKNAAVIGFLYNNKASKKPSEAGHDFTILAAQFNNIRDDLRFNYQLIMLLDKSNESDFEIRLNKAFNEIDSDKAKKEELLFEDYCRGGIEILYKKLIENSNKPEDYLLNLFDFIQEINERYNKDISTENILEMCRDSNIYKND